MSSSGAERQFDLEERTARFGEGVVTFAKTIPFSPVNSPLISQIVRSSTSIGANYCEADDAVSKKEFFQKIGTCKKEARETKHWLRMLAAAEPDRKKKSACSGRKRKSFTLSSPRFSIAVEKAKEKSRKARGTGLTHCSLVIPYSFTHYSFSI